MTALASVVRLDYSARCAATTFMYRRGNGSAIMAMSSSSEWERAPMTGEVGEMVG